MGEGYKFKQENPAEVDRAVAVEGKFLGREVGEHSLRQYTEKAQEEGANMVGNDAFTEIYFETASGNVYKIYNGPDGKWALLDARSNQGKGREARGTNLSEEDLQKGILKVGQPFRYGRVGRTTEITKITCVNGNRIYQEDWLRNTSQGITSNVSERMRKMIMPQEKGK